MKKCIIIGIFIIVSSICSACENKEEINVQTNQEPMHKAGNEELYQVFTPNKPGIARGLIVENIVNYLDLNPKWN